MATRTRHRIVALRIALPRQPDLDRVALCITTRKKKSASRSPLIPTATSTPAQRQPRVDRLHHAVDKPDPQTEVTAAESPSATATERNDLREATTSSSPLSRFYAERSRRNALQLSSHLQIGPDRSINPLGICLLKAAVPEVLFCDVYERLLIRRSDGRTRSRRHTIHGRCIDARAHGTRQQVKVPENAESRKTSRPSHVATVKKIRSRPDALFCEPGGDLYPP